MINSNQIAFAVGVSVGTSLAFLTLIVLVWWSNRQRGKR